MASSTAYAVKAALFAAIRSLPEAAAEAWDIDFGFSKNPERTWVYCGGIDWESSEWVTNRTREEVYTITAVVNVKRRRATPADAEGEAVRIMGLIESYVNANNRLGVFGVELAELVPKKLDSMPSDDFCEAQFEASVRVTARF